MKAEIPAAQELAGHIIKERFGGAAEVQIPLQIQEPSNSLCSPPPTCLASLTPHELIYIWAGDMPFTAEERRAEASRARAKHRYPSEPLMGPHCRPSRPVDMCRICRALTLHLNCRVTGSDVATSAAHTDAAQLRVLVLANGPRHSSACLLAFLPVLGACISTEPCMHVSCSSLGAAGGAASRPSPTTRHLRVSAGDYSCSPDPQVPSGMATPLAIMHAGIMFHVLKSVLAPSRECCRRMPDMLLCIRDNFEITPAPEDTSLQTGAVAESFLNVLFQHGRLRCLQHLNGPVLH